MMNKKTEKEIEEKANKALGKVTVTIKLPEPVFHFYRAVADAYNKKLEDILVEELIVDIKGFTDTDAEKILIGAFELESFVQ